MKKLSKTLEPTASHRLVVPMRYLGAGMTTLLPFHAFLTVWSASLIGHYTWLRLWKEFVLVALVLGAVGLVVLMVLSGQLRAGWRPILRRRPVLILISAYLILLVGLGLSACALGDVTPKAFAYGLLLDARFLIFFLVMWLIARHDGWILAHWRQLVLIPACIVVIFGLLQATLLPSDALRHFGYGANTIDAVQTIDQKAGYQRVQSTLRGANPLGAYLVVIIAALAVLLARSRARRWQYGVLAAGSLALLALTFSRSAWLGAAAAIVWLVWSSIASGRTRKLLLVSGSVAVLVAAAGGYTLRNNDVFQNTILHTDEHSLSATSSNHGHLSAAKDGIDDIIHQPQGGGTGTAGPASVYNNRPARIAENYYLQIGQEVGLAGLALFVAVNLVVGRALWQRRSEPVAQMLLASLIGISLVNLLSHAWTDDTLSYIWWGLAGTALALPRTHSVVSAEREQVASR